ncbi:FecR protein [Thalassoglobus neptunius]|uniref:FecR protein n=1 Tax=Thalassoglobus neptunius TaxID=1938619 RepID=A0A5C5VYF8_9PLAN|nr:FecR family protein [Thalassoglobus neptunius]TWT42779.1 FecR protein [Thalassoglobus neptunius]
MGTYTEDEARSFCERLKQDAEFRRLYLETAALRGHLRVESAFRMEQSGESNSLQPSSATRSSGERHSTRPKAFIALVLTLAVVFVGVTAWLLSGSDRSSGLDHQLTHERPDENGPRLTNNSTDRRDDVAPTIDNQDRNVDATPIAEFARSVDASWPLGATRWSVGDFLRRGDTVSLGSGRAELVFSSGAIMSLVGPAELVVHSGISVSLNSGTATTRVEGVGKGEFKVFTPTTEVLDLGTEFGIMVHPGNSETDVVVFDGEVDVTSLTGRDQNSGDRLPPQRLSVGEAAHFKLSGEWDRVVSVNRAAFPFGSQMYDVSMPRSDVILNVTDNLSSSSRPKFYEVVPNGFGEDARAFVDRTHEWNGIDSLGIPSYLLGKDYIRTFNDDKFNTDIEITVELSQSADVYVLYAILQSPRPHWLVSEFEDTGVVIGLDEAEFVSPKGFHVKQSVEVGPGKSIDSKFSLWKKTVRDNLNVVLGAISSDENTGQFKANYGIIVVPLN